MPHPDEVPIRQKVYRLFLQYRRKGTVTKLLNAAGHRTREKKLWCDRQITRLLTETSAKGIYYFNRLNKQSSWRGIEKPEAEWGRVECEPIVETSVWEQANQILEEQLEAYKKPGKLPTHTFGNLTWCHCGHKMYARSDFPRILCRKCNHKIQTTDLESACRKELLAFFGTPERVTAHLTAAQQNLSEKQTVLVAHEQEVAKVREEMTRTHRLYLDGQITPQGFGQFYKPAEERLNRLLTELPKLQAQVIRLKVTDISPEEVASEAHTLHDRWPSLNPDEKRRVAEAMIEKIVIGHGEINLTLNPLLTSEELCKTQQQAAAAHG